MKHSILTISLILFSFILKVNAQNQFIGLGLQSNYTGYNLVFDYVRKVGRTECSIGIKYLFKNQPGKYDGRGFNHKFHPEATLEHLGVSAGLRHFYPIKGSDAKLGWFNDIQFTSAPIDMVFVKSVTQDTFIFEPYHSKPISVFSNNIGLVLEVSLNRDVLFCTGVGAGINIWGFQKSQWYISAPSVFARVKINLDRFRKVKRQ